MKLLRINARLPQPRISHSLTDPLGAAPRVNRMDRAVKARFKRLRPLIIDLFRSIPVAQVNEVSAGNYYYDFSATRAAGFLDELQRLLDDVLMEDDSSGRMWAGIEVQDAYQGGTATTQSQLSSLSVTYKDQRTLATILYSEPYLNRLQLAYTKTYSDWRGLSDYARQQLASTIMEAIARGDNPRNVESLINERLDVSLSRARSMAQTEITGALREANRKEVKEAEITLGLETVMLWMSALKPTTRPSHSAKHGKFFTPEEIEIFYSEGGNRYNCYCSQVPALLIDNEPVILESSQDRMNKQRKNWEDAHKQK